MVDRPGLVGGWLMDAVLVAIVLHGLLTGAGLVWGLSLLHQRMIESIDDLDGSIAQAIEAVIGGVQDMEPVNPIQQALAAYISQQFEQPVITAQVRDVGGKFSDEKNNNA